MGGPGARCRGTARKRCFRGQPRAAGRRPGARSSRAASGFPLQPRQRLSGQQLRRQQRHLRGDDQNSRVPVQPLQHSGQGGCPGMGAVAVARGRLHQFVFRAGEDLGKWNERGQSEVVRHSAYPGHAQQHHHPGAARVVQPELRSVGALRLPEGSQGGHAGPGRACGGGFCRPQ
ncbi:hypothetical protein D9M68_716640 [compost metagenome]